MANCDEAAMEANVRGNKRLLLLTSVASVMATGDNSPGWSLLGTREKESDKLRCLNSRF